MELRSLEESLKRALVEAQGGRAPTVVMVNLRAALHFIEVSRTVHDDGRSKPRTIELAEEALRVFNDWKARV